MKVLYLDCKSGISGDMFAAAMLDLGVESEGLLAALKLLHLDVYDINITKKLKNGIAATDFNVIVHHTHEEEGIEHNHDHHSHSTFGEIKALINDSGLSDYIKEKSIKVFEIIAIAESKVHMTDVESVLFHEVGAVDSIVDIVAAAYCMEQLKPDCVICSALTEGSGFINSSHGLLPVPCPATLEIMKNAKIPFECGDIKGELVTPTGAAIVAAIAQSFGVMPQMCVEKIGYGCGKKDFAHPNVLRAIFGVDNVEIHADKIAVLETCIDDSTGEALGFCLELLLEAGANDAYYTPVFMKKNRPAYQLTVLCGIADIDKMSYIIFGNTGSIGMRCRVSDRIIMNRQQLNAETKYGKISYKACTIGDITKFKPEFEDVKNAVKKYNTELNDVTAEFYKVISK